MLLKLISLKKLLLTPNAPFIFIASLFPTTLRKTNLANKIPLSQTWINELLLTKVSTKQPVNKKIKVLVQLQQSYIHSNLMTLKILVYM